MLKKTKREKTTYKFRYGRKTKINIILRDKRKNRA